jgi:hypothetical protein
MAWAYTGKRSITPPVVEKKNSLQTEVIPTPRQESHWSDVRTEGKLTGGGHRVKPSGTKRASRRNLLQKESATVSTYPRSPRSTSKRCYSCKDLPQGSTLAVQRVRLINQEFSKESAEKRVMIIGRSVWHTSSHTAGLVRYRHLLRPEKATSSAFPTFSNDIMPHHRSQERASVHH